MEQPADVNLAQLQRFLGKSKMVMEATKVNVPGNNSQNHGGGNQMQPTQYSNDGMAEKPLPDMNQMLAAKGYQTNIQVPQYDENVLYEEAVQNSKLPPHIKKLMAEQRIEQPMPSGAPIPQSAMAAMSKQLPQKQQINERIQSPTATGSMNVGFSREEMKAMMKECLSELMMESITETAIKGTLKKMMTEGKLKVKK